VTMWCSTQTQFFFALIGAKKSPASFATAGQICLIAINLIASYALLTRASGCFSASIETKDGGKYNVAGWYRCLETLPAAGSRQEASKPSTH